MPLPRMIPSRNLPPRCWLLLRRGGGWGWGEQRFLRYVCVCVSLYQQFFIIFLFFFPALQNKEGKGKARRNRDP